MPTLRHRYTITETDQLARALDHAALVWPELRDDRNALLQRIIERGHDTVVRSSEVKRAERRAAIRETAGIMSGVFPENARELLREEWPE